MVLFRNKHYVVAGFVIIDGELKWWLGKTGTWVELAEISSLMNEEAAFDGSGWFFDVVRTDYVARYITLIQEKVSAKLKRIVG